MTSMLIKALLLIVWSSILNPIAHFITSWSAKQNPYLYLCLHNSDFVFLFPLFQMLSTWSTCGYLSSPPWVPSLLNLGVDITYLKHNTRIEVSPLVVSITKTKYRAISSINGKFLDCLWVLTYYRWLMRCSMIYFWLFKYYPCDVSFYFLKNFFCFPFALFYLLLIFSIYIIYEPLIIHVVSVRCSIVYFILFE